MKFTAIVATSLAAVSAQAISEEERASAWAVGGCPWVQPTTYSESNSEFDIASMHGIWYQVQKPNDVPFGDDTVYGCGSASFTARPDAWFGYNTGLNFGAYDLTNKELFNMYSDESAGVDNSWLDARSDNLGNVWGHMTGMPFMTMESRLQVLYADSDLVVLHSCADMMAVHWSGATVFAKSKTLTDAQRALVNDTVNRLVPAAEYTSADLLDTYHGSDCVYNTFNQ